MDTIFTIIFFAAMIGASLLKGIMEDRERERTHERARRMKSPEPSRPRGSSARRTIGGYSVFENREPARKPSIAENFGFGEEDAKIEERIKSYEEQIAEAEALIAAEGAKASKILCGEIECEGAQSGVRALINSRENLASAVILSEILMPPVSMRGSNLNPRF